jgi:hypothetical protein
MPIGCRGSRAFCGADAARRKSGQFRQERKGLNMAKRRDDDDKDQIYDPKGARGGDTGPTAPLGSGPQAEKGDQRRDLNAHSGPTRRGAQGGDAAHGHRSGSESDAGR